VFEIIWKNDIQGPNIYYQPHSPVNFLGCTRQIGPTQMISCDWSLDVSACHFTKSICLKSIGISAGGVGVWWTHLPQNLAWGGIFFHLKVAYLDFCYVNSLHIIVLINSFCCSIRCTVYVQICEKCTIKVG